MGAVLILIITTPEHRYTHLNLYRDTALDIEVVSYDDVLRRRTPRRATHVFTDIDRLPSWRVHEAALMYRKVRDAGFRALNDPARFLGRFGLLRSLNRAGINDFDAYRVDGIEAPRKWPVFLRLEGDHHAPVSGLLEDQASLNRALQEAIEGGAPRSALLIIEYAAEPVRPGLYRKLSVFRVGDRVLGYTCVHDGNWLVKYGTSGIAPADLYDEEYSLIAENPFGAAAKTAFDLAGIEYGRVDFGLVGGKPQFYEINSNPYISLEAKAPNNERRSASLKLFRTNYIEAVKGIDFAPRASWRVKSSVAARRAELLPGRARRVLTRVFPARPGSLPAEPLTT